MDGLAEDGGDKYNAGHIGIIVIKRLTRCLTGLTVF